MDNTYVLGPNGELYHWGIKGMKWGIRRYQNKDGSLTPAGRKRYDDSEDEKVQPAKKKSVRDMTDDELSRAIARARAEDEYNRLRPEKAPEPEKKPSFAKKFMEDAVKPALINSGRKAMESAMDKVVKDLLKDKVDPDSLEALKKTFDKLDYKQRIDKIQNPDKYLNEEDRTKRQKRERDAADWEAQMEGYADAADKAAKTRARAKAEAEAAEIAADKARRDAHRKAMNRSAYRHTNDESPDARRERMRDEIDQDEFDFDYEPERVKTGTVEGSGRSRKNSETAREKDHTIFDSDNVYRDADGYYRYRESDPVTDLVTTRNASRGSDWASRYEDIYISGLLPAPKDDD